ncbi:MAG: polymer-forming cytoskeletal protein [Firmicutes bacterium]|nr:polymer-forming cytoskeletal protein [Bacillota bacterium]
MIMDGKNQIQTIIGKATSFRGTIGSTENIQIDGKHQGELVTKGNLYVSETGEVEGKAQADNLLLAGVFHGEAKVNGKLEIITTGKFQGEAEMSIFVVEEGARFQGDCRQNKK